MKNINKLETTIIGNESAKILLIQPVDSHDLEELDNEVSYIRENSDVPFRLIAVHVKKWFNELAPWPAPPVFGKTPFGDGAKQTLRGILEILENHKTISDVPIILGGYSLAGLFALWASTEHHFDGIVAASPSVWYNDWLKYSDDHDMLSEHIYLSLGDKEHHSKNQLMASVENCIKRQLDILKAKRIDSILEMNPGNHFQDNGIRTGKGFVWNMNRIVHQ